MRVDTTVVETNIHYPDRQQPVGDGVRVLTRTMKKVTAIVGRGRRDPPRPEPRRQAAADGDRPDRAKQGRAPSGETDPRVSAALRSDEPRGGAGETVRAGDSDGVKHTADVIQQAALEGLRQELDTFVPA